MTERPWTQGPWRLFNTEQVQGIEAADGSTVCTFDKLGWLPNGQLLAAAPDLFEALEEMLTAFSMQNIGVDASRRRTNAKKQARDALAKALPEKQR